MELKPGMLCFCITRPNTYGWPYNGHVVTLVNQIPDGRWNTSPEKPALRGPGKGSPLVWPASCLKRINPDDLKDEEDVYSTKPIKADTHIPKLHKEKT